MNAYDDLIMDHIRNARNYRVPEDFHRQASGTNPLCGDEVVVYLKIEGDCIAHAAFQCTCCGISMASASIMTEIVTGKTVAEVSRAVQAFAGALRDPSVPSSAHRFTADQLALVDTLTRFPARSGCAMLPWLTLEEAL